MSNKIKCGCSVFYFFSGRPECLHRLFDSGQIQAITRELTRDGAEFLIWGEKLHKNKRGRYAGKYNLTGGRSKLGSREQIILAIELARKHNIQRIRL